MPRTRVRFWGVRGSIPAPGAQTAFYGGNTSCLEVRVDNELIVLDAGTGIRPLGLALKAEFWGQPVEMTLLVTHTHWDHIQGFPFFLPAYTPGNKINILGFEGAAQGLHSTLSGQMEGTYFPVSMQAMAGNITVENLESLEFWINSVPVRAQFVNHPGTCAGYRIGEPGCDIAYLPDIELPNHLRDEAPEDQSTADPHQQALVEFVRGAEMLVVDAQYTAAEYEEHVGWGHSCLEDSVAFALQAGVKRLFLFHHDPDHTDEQVTQMVARAREIVAQRRSPLVVEAAREGCEVVLDSNRLGD